MGKWPGLVWWIEGGEGLVFLGCFAVESDVKMVGLEGRSLGEVWAVGVGLTGETRSAVLYWSCDLYTLS